MEHAATVQLVRLITSGKNALDFALAYYVGCAVMADPTGTFHIVSKDKGFDSLVEHLRSRHIFAHRHDDFSTLTFSETTKPPSLPSGNLMPRALECLGKQAKNRPKCRKKLVSHLRTICGKTATEADIVDLVEKLCKSGRLSIDDKDAVTYHD
jgi:hypothetical protein